MTISPWFNCLEGGGGAQETEMCTETGLSDHETKDKNKKAFTFWLNTQLKYLHKKLRPYLKQLHKTVS